MSKKDNDFDFIDQLFDRLQSGDFVNKTVNEFGNEVKNTIDRSVKNQGYDNIQDMVSSAIKSKPSEKPGAGDNYPNRNDFKNRYEYLIGSLQNVHYDSRYRGFYRDGHQEAIKKCVSYLHEKRINLDEIEDYITDEIHEYRRSRRKKRDKYLDGYLDGLMLFKDKLADSKLFIMNKIKNSLVNK